ncbi:hypothetical protein RhiirC2_788697 [Rhizophagus irregularis]|uniref:F-box domain-containing protein n=1 Tax=Rhizophagus irregularis TaxID=588596 RepID=A0A2N1MPL0_9GLOM|nr:hypothetical protein RhiirC2_788697 [Rhizophagus irregularis]
MSKLNSDILEQIFQDLNDLNQNIKYRISLFPCLLVNKLWYEVMISILWSYPYKNVYNEKLLFNIIISHLSDKIIKLLIDKNIIKTNFKKQKLSFNYVKFCKYLNNIEIIFPNESRLLRKKIYKHFIRECSSIKCLSKDMLYYPLYKYPRANISLSNLYELNCDIKEKTFYFYHELAQICRSIEKIRINIYKVRNDEFDEIVELIEMQKQIKYISILDERNERLLDENDKCNRIIQSLEKHVNSINYIDVIMNTSSLHFSFSKLINLQFLKILNKKMYEISENFEKYIMKASYYKLQILDLQSIPLHIVIKIIQNTNGNLYKIKIRYPDCDQAEEYNRTIHKYCPNIKYVTIFLNRSNTLKELKNILIKCQHLEAIDMDEYIEHKYLNKFLDLLIKLAPLTLYKIHIHNEFENFNIKSLKLFFNNWNLMSKKTLHLYYHNYHNNDWFEFIENHKIKGVIGYKYHDNDFWNYEQDVL